MRRCHSVCTAFRKYISIPWGRRESCLKYQISQRLYSVLTASLQRPHDLSTASLQRSWPRRSAIFWTLCERCKDATLVWQGFNQSRWMKTFLNYKNQNIQKFVYCPFNVIILCFYVPVSNTQPICKYNSSSVTGL